MRQKDLLLLASGFGLGALAFSLAPKAERPVATPAAATPQTPSLLQPQAVAAVAKTLLPKETETPEETARTVAAAHTAVGFRDVQVAERVAVLCERLKLSEEQAKFATKLMQSLAPTGEELSALTNATGEDLEAARWAWASESWKRAASFESEFGGKLSETQNAEWRKFQEERKSNQVESMANRELARLQERLTLTPEQKDAVFSVLSKDMAGDLSGPVEAQLSDTVAEARRMTLVEDLQGVLSPSQLQLLETLPSTEATPQSAPLFDFADTR